MNYDIDNWTQSDKNHLEDYLHDNAYKSDKFKLLYIATPKVACTSLKWWMAKIEGVSHAILNDTSSIESTKELSIHDTFYKVAPSVTGLTLTELTNAITSDEYFRFALVRNPFKRIFSAWQSKILMMEPIQATPYRNYPFYNHNIKTPSDIATAFELFLEHLITSEDPTFMDRHWMPQIQLLRPDLINYSSITQIEKFNKVEVELCEWSNGKLPSPFKAKRSNESLIPFVGKFISNRSAELIRSMYADDFTNFGYSLELPKDKETFSDEQCIVAIQALKLIQERHLKLAETHTNLKQLTDALTTNERQLELAHTTITNYHETIRDLNQILISHDERLNAIYQNTASFYTARTLKRLANYWKSIKNKL